MQNFDGMKLAKNQKLLSLELVFFESYSSLFFYSFLLLILSMVFTKDVANYRLLLWPWSLVTFSIFITQQTVTIATMRGASERCTCDGAAFWARGWMNIAWRRLWGSIVVRMVLMAAAGVTVRSAGRETWKRADWWGRCLITC